MKRTITTILLSITTILAFSQSWDILGNGSTNPTNNFIGTTDNNAFVTRTFNTPRMKLNGDVNYDINGVGSAARNGYLLLGGNTNLSYDGTPIYNTGAFSMLHLNGFLVNFA